MEIDIYIYIYICVCAYCIYIYIHLSTCSWTWGPQVLFRALWQDRWAHALFDGLYPAYVSLARQDTVLGSVWFIGSLANGIDR